MDEVHRGNYQIIPIKISEYIEENSPTTYVMVRTGAWNVANTSGYDFSQWEGTEKQQAAIEEHIILKAETSCNLFWVMYRCT